jgi:hypothetical protein
VGGKRLYSDNGQASSGLTDKQQFSSVLLKIYKTGKAPKKAEV